MVKPYQKEKDILEGIRKAEEKLLKTIQLECDWSSLEDRNERSSDKRLEDRDRVLNELVPNRICKECSKTYLKNRSWIVNNDRAICRSCFFRQRIAERMSKLSERCLGKDLFSEPQIFVRYALNKQRMMDLRKGAGMSISEFARRAGWSRSYQRKLESDLVSTVTEDTKETILSVFREVGEEDGNN